MTWGTRGARRMQGPAGDPVAGPLHDTLPAAAGLMMPVMIPHTKPKTGERSVVGHPELTCSHGVRNLDATPCTVPFRHVATVSYGTSMTVPHVCTKLLVDDDQMEQEGERQKKVASFHEDRFMFMQYS